MMLHSFVEQASSSPMCRIRGMEEIGQIKMGGWEGQQTCAWSLLESGRPGSVRSRVVSYVREMV